MTDLLELGHRINLARKKADMSLEDVAYEVGVAASTIQRYEKGNITRIKLPVVGAIATALNVSPDWLLQKTDDPIDYYRIANEEGIVVPRDSDMNEEQILSYLKYKISESEQISKKQCVLTDDGIKNVYRIIHKLFTATDAIVTDVSKYLDYVTYTNKSEVNDDE